MTGLVGSFAPILTPILVLVIWTLVMLAWLALTRLPYMAAQKMGPEKGERTAELGALLPKQIQWKADNYNHLLEQPTAFYATAIASALVGMGDGLNLTLAWIYVVSRILHSLVHATVNKVLIRFSLFAIGSLSLLVMASNTLISLLT